MKGGSDADPAFIFSANPCRWPNDWFSPTIDCSFDNTMTHEPWNHKPRTVENVSIPAHSAFAIDMRIDTQIYIKYDFTLRSRRGARE
jgi:hypothetical protein